MRTGLGAGLAVLRGALAPKAGRGALAGTSNRMGLPLRARKLPPAPDACSATLGSPERARRVCLPGLEASRRSASSMSRSTASSREREGCRSRLGVSRPGSQSRARSRPRSLSSSGSAGGLPVGGRPAEARREPAGVDQPEQEGTGVWRPDATEPPEAAGVQLPGVEPRGGRGVGFGAFGPRPVTGSRPAKAPAKSQAEASRLCRLRPSSSPSVFGRPAARTKACQAPLPGRGVFAGVLRTLRALLGGVLV